MFDNIYVYIFIFSLLAFLFQLKKDLKCISIILIIIMYVVCALRSPSAGADTMTYLQIYGNPNALENNKSEFAFYWIVKILYNINVPVWFTQVLMTTILYSTFGYVIIKLSSKPSLSILIFVIAVNTYFTESFSLTRQCIATGFLLICWDYINNGNYKKSIVWLVFAIGFHMTSIAYIPLAILAYYWRFSKQFLFFALIVGIIFAFIFSSVSLISNSISKLGDFGLNKYAEYATYELGQSRTRFGLISDLIPISILAYYAFTHLNKQFIVRLLCLGVLCLDIVSIMPTAYRMTYGLIAIEILIYPLCYLKRSPDKWIIYMLIVYLISFWLYRVPNMEAAKLLPYEFGPSLLFNY